MNRFIKNYINKKSNDYISKNNFEKANQIAKYVVERGNDEDCLNFAMEFGDRIDCSVIMQRFITKRNPEYLLKYIENVKGCDVQFAQEQLQAIDREGKYLARLINVPGADVNKVVDFYLDKGGSDNDMMLLKIASHNIPRDAFERIQDYIFSKENPYYADIMARFCGRKCNNEKAQEIALKSNDPELLERFFLQANGADKAKSFRRLEEVIYSECNSYITVKEFIEKYERLIGDKEKFVKKLNNLEAQIDRRNQAPEM